MEGASRSKSNDEKFLCGSSKQNVVKLLEEARKLQVEHKRLMSRSKGRSSDMGSASPLRVSAGSGLKSPSHSTNIHRIKQPLRDRSEESRTKSAEKKNKAKRVVVSPPKKVGNMRTPPHQLYNVW